MLIQKGGKLESRGELGCVYIYIYFLGHLYTETKGEFSSQFIFSASPELI